MRLMVWLAAALCLCAKAQAGEPAQAIVQASDLRHVGAFRLPVAAPPGQTWRSLFSYGGTALAYNPKHHSLFLVGHDHHQLVAEVSIPEPVDSDTVADLPTAKVLQPFADITGGLLNNKIGGLLVYGDRLLWTSYVYYDAAAAAKTSHGTSTLDLSHPAARGVYALAGIPAGAVAGFMSLVPDDWRERFGVPVLTGQAGVPIVSRTSAGPAAVGFDPDGLGNKPAPATVFLYYPLRHPLGPLEQKNPVWCMGTVGGMAFVSRGGKAAVMFFGARGLGDYWYGGPEEGGHQDLSHTAKGPHAPPYEATVWCYDANDLLAVKAGRKESWRCQPYQIAKLSGLYPSQAWAPIAGVAYDPAAGRLYVSQRDADLQGYERLPVIHVYEVQVSNK
jgi:hypothetical protein